MSHSSISNARESQKFMQIVSETLGVQKELRRVP